MRKIKNPLTLLIISIIFYTIVIIICVTIDLAFLSSICVAGILYDVVSYIRIKLNEKS